MLFKNIYTFFLMIFMFYRWTWCMNMNVIFSVGSWRLLIITSTYYKKKYQTFMYLLLTLVCVSVQKLYLSCTHTNKWKYVYCVQCGVLKVSNLFENFSISLDTWTQCVHTVADTNTSVTIDFTHSCSFRVTRYLLWVYRVECRFLFVP